MNSKISVFLKVLAVLLSVIFFITANISYFSLPLEMVFFNVNNVFQALDDERTQSQIPLVISELTGDIFYQSYAGIEIPEILSDREEFKYILKEYIPTDWSINAIGDFTDYTYEFLNFRATESSLRLNISYLKELIIRNKFKISQDLFAAQKTCGPDQMIQDTGIGIDVYDLPKCRLDEDVQIEYNQILGNHLENQFVRIPSNITIDYVMFGNEEGLSKYFNYYTLTRWALRLMPLIAIGILILISVFLRENRKFRLRWVGRLLVISSAISLFGLIIFLIGFNQFTSLFIKRTFPGFVPGFDDLFLRIVQEVGYKTLAWTVAAAGGTFIFGLMILFTSRFFRNPKPKEETMLEELPVVEKEIKPETIEEIEEKENEEKKNKK